MTLTIGRAAVDNPEKVSSSGERVTFEGDIAPSNGTDALNVDEFLARRAQLVNMIANPDMDVWPVTWTEDDTFDGFWTVRRADVDPASVYLATGVGRYRVELERPTGLVSPLVECTTTSLIMTNAAGVTSTDAKSVWAVPGEADAVESPSKAATQPAAGTRTPDGDAAVKLFRVASGQSSGTYVVTPADFFSASARVEVTYDAGTTYYETVGRSFAVAADNWRLNNGFVRVSPSAGTDLLDISFFNGSTWCAAQPVNLLMQFPTTPTYNYRFNYDTIVGARVLRNSPEVCTLRLTIKPSSLLSGSDDWMVSAYATLDLTLRRGEVLVRCAHTPRGAYGYSYVGVGTAAGAQTSLTSGVRADGTVNSGRILMGFADAFATGNTSQGTPGVYLYRNATARFCIGYEIAGASASTYNAAQQVIYQWLASLSERQRVVLR